MVEQMCDWPLVGLSDEVPDAVLVPPAPTVRDAFEDPAGTATWLAAHPAGPRTVAAFEALDPDVLGPAVLGPDGLSTPVLLDLLTAAARLQSWAAAAEQRVLAALDLRISSEGSFPEKGYARDQVAAVLRLSPRNAADRLAVARALDSMLPATAAALEAGRISYLHARVIATETDCFSTDLDRRRAVEDAVLARADHLTVGQLRTAVRRDVLRRDPADATDRHARARARRHTGIRPEPDGMATFWAFLPAPDAHTLTAALDALADRHPDQRADAPPGGQRDRRTKQQRRADALTQLARAALSDPRLPRRHGARASISVCIALSTLTGWDHQPAHLDGYGPIPADLARTIACDPTATWRRLIVDDHGQLLDFGRSTYRPPANLRDHVLARSRTCIFPGCSTPARRCDIDHHTDRAYGGATNHHNLGPVCERHHQLKHEAGWTVERLPDGRVRWTDPYQRQYHSRPETCPVDNWTDDITSAERPWQPDYPDPPSYPGTAPSDLPDDPPF